MRRMISGIKRYRLSVLVSLVVIGIGVVSISLFYVFGQHSMVRVFRTDTYALNYDTTWKVKSKDLQSIVFSHHSGSLFSIELVTLDGDSKYSSIDDLIDEVMYSIEQQNTSYKLLSKVSEKVTKNSFAGYKLLYETDSDQAMVVVYKKSEKLVIMVFEAKNDYFDILLDSVWNMIYSFDTIEESFDLKQEINMDTGDVTFTANEEVTSALKGTISDEIARNNYLVEYSIPDNFKSTSFRSDYASYKYEGLEDGEISLTVHTYNRNIYEYLDRDRASNVYSSYEYYKTGEDYSDFQEVIDELDSEDEGYIYKNSFWYKTHTYDKDFNKVDTTEIRENVVLVYALNANHILLFEFSSKKITIPEELIDKVKIDKVTNYSSYVKFEKDGSNWLGTLKRVTNYTTYDYEEVTLRVPDKWSEYDMGSNVYEYRYYRTGYDALKDLYDYEVTYYLTGTFSEIDGQVDIINNGFSHAYGEYHDLALSGDITVNDKSFTVYDGGYTNLGGVFFTDIDRFYYYIPVKVLFYALDNGGYLVVTIRGNDKEIGDDVIRDVTNFVVENKKY